MLGRIGFWGVVMVGMLCLAGRSVNAQVRPAMTLVLIDDAGVRSAPYAALGGTVVVGRTDTGHASAAAADQAAPDRADVAFEPGLLDDKAFLKWVATSGPKAVAELTVSGKGAVAYSLTGIVSRIMTVTQSADGAGQISLVLAAEHVSVGTTPLN